MIAANRGLEAMMAAKAAKGDAKEAVEAEGSAKEEAAKDSAAKGDAAYRDAAKRAVEWAKEVVAKRKKAAMAAKKKAAKAKKKSAMGSAMDSPMEEEKAAKGSAKEDAVETAGAVPGDAQEAAEAESSAKQEAALLCVFVGKQKSDWLAACVSMSLRTMRWGLWERLGSMGGHGWPCLEPRLLSHSIIVL